MQKADFKPSENFKCSFTCKLENVGILEKGTIQKDKMKDMLKKTPKVFEECSKFSGSSCDVAYDTFNCLYKTESKVTG